LSRDALQARLLFASAAMVFIGGEALTLGAGRLLEGRMARVA